MTNPPEQELGIGKILSLSFNLAIMSYHDVYKEWIDISHSIAGRTSQAAQQQIGWLGQLDVVLRSLEAENALPHDAPRNQLSLQSSLSETWICTAYEVFRSARQRGLTDQGTKQLRDRLNLVRVPIVKYEIAQDDELKDQVKLVPYTGAIDHEYTYDSSDKQNKSHIMPTGLSHRGSFCWQVIDTKGKREFFVERLSLSEEILDHLRSV